MKYQLPPFGSIETTIGVGFKFDDVEHAGLPTFCQPFPVQMYKNMVHLPPKRYIS